MVEHDDQTRVTKEIHKLRTTLERQGRWSTVLGRGLLSGMATAIGATVIAGIVIALLAWVLHQTGLDQWLPKLG